MNKGISITYLTKTGLCNLNSGEGESNGIDMKKYVYQMDRYYYVSGQAIRYYIKEAIRYLTNEHACIPDSKGQSCGHIHLCPLCDLMGFMNPMPNSGSDTRTSPVSVSPAQAVYPIKAINNDFMTGVKNNIDEPNKKASDMIHTEISKNLYKGGYDIDINKISCVRKFKEDKWEVANPNPNAKKKKIEKSLMYSEYEPVFEDETEYMEKKINRIKMFLEAIMMTKDYGKQSRLMTDFTPDIVVLSTQTKLNHRLQKLFEVDKQGNVNLQRVRDILEEMKDYSDFYVGMIDGVVSNQKELVDLFTNEYNIPVSTPKGAIDEVIEEVPILCMDSDSD